MSDAPTRKVAPLYQRYTDSGTRRENRAGVEAALKGGDDASAQSVTWEVKAGTLAGLEPKPENDVLRDTAGRWWVVKQVGPLTGGVYPLLCERWNKEGGA